MTLGKKILMMSLILATPATAAEIEVEGSMGKVASLNVQGCGNGAQARLEDTGANEGKTKQTLAIDFDDLSLDTSAQSGAATCSVQAKINVEPGMRFCVGSGSVQGYGDMKSRYGSVSFNYSAYETGAQAAAQRGLPANQLTDLRLEAKVVQPQFTRCSERQQVVNLRGDLTLQLGPGAADGSAIRVTGQAVTYATGWNWAWMDCFSGAFKSQYRAYNGHTYQAKIELVGDRGTYTSSAGFVGQVWGVKRDGRQVTAQWSALGSNGWFKFYIRNFDTMEFTGTWGDQRGEQGTWDGRGM